MGMAASQLWNTGDIVAIGVPFDDDAELSAVRFSHKDGMPELGRRRKAA